MESLERRDMLAASMELVVDMDVNAHVRHRFVAGDSTYQIVEYKDENGTDLSSVGRIDNGVPQAVEFSGRLWHWVLDDQVYVVSHQDRRNFALWKTDGTEQGTTRLFATHGTSSIADPTLFNDRLYFTAGDELWVSDGTEEGATPLLSASRQVDNLRLFNDQLYFTVESHELWVSDGTEEGTTRLLRTGEIGYNITEINDQLLITVDSHDLWITDGTDEGTTRLVARGEEGNLSSLTVFNDKLYFTKDHKLWFSDGTPDGTRPFTDDISIISDLGTFAVAESQLFLIDEAGTLWRTDGTDEGTYPLPSANSRFVGVDGYRVVGVVGDRVFYLAGGRRHGEGCGGWTDGQLWVSDGTLSGTHQLTDDFLALDGVSRGRSDSAIVAGESLFFGAEDGAGNLALWKSDGTREGTVRLKDMWFQPIVAAGGIVYLAGDDGATGTELWRTNGTPEGTVQVSDFNKGTRGSLNQRRIDTIMASNGMLYFTADDGIHGFDLWRIPLDVPGDESSFIPQAGDANGDGQFDQLDLTALLQAGKYNSQQAATFEEGDFDRDGLFNQQDIVAALQTGSYLQGPYTSETESDHHDV